MAASFDEQPDHGLRDPVVRAAWWRLLADNLTPAPSRVADLECGTGSLSVLLSERGYSVTGLDSSRAMLGVARAWCRSPIAAIGARRSSVSATCWSVRPPERGRSGGGSRGREFGSLRVVIEHMFDKI